MFDPKKHTISLKGKDYLPVAPRIAWFRDTHASGSITTDLLQFDPFPIVRATITDGDGRTLATGYGTAQVGGKAVYAGREIEKAETAAIGRALAAAGFGTLQAGAEFDDSDNLADSPVSRTNGRNTPEPAANGNSGPHMPGKWASEKTVTKLMTAARDEYPDVTWAEVRRAAGVDGDTPEAWNVFPTAQAAYDVMMAALDKATETAEAVTE